MHGNAFLPLAMIRGQISVSLPPSNPSVRRSFQHVHANAIHTYSHGVISDGPQLPDMRPALICTPCDIGWYISRWPLSVIGAAPASSQRHLSRLSARPDESRSEILAMGGVDGWTSPFSAWHSFRRPGKILPQHEQLA